MLRNCCGLWQPARLLSVTRRWNVHWRRSSSKPSELTMVFEELRTLWLVLRREYVQRVKSLSFLASTIAAPLLFLALAATPALFASPRPIYPKHIVVVCSAPEPARQIEDAFRDWGLGHYRAEIVVAATPRERDELTVMV